MGNNSDIETKCRYVYKEMLKNLVRLSFGSHVLRSCNFLELSLFVYSDICHYVKSNNQR